MRIAERQIARPQHPWQIGLRRIFAKPSVEITIGVLVLVSVVLTIFEFFLESRFEANQGAVETIFGTFNQAHLWWIGAINDAITVAFIVELSLRFFAAPSKRRFFGEFWLDILATLPVFRIFRSARALRLLRLVRLFRLMGVISRLSSHYPYIIRRGAVEFVMICGLLALAIIFGTVGMMHFESGHATADPNSNVITADGVAEPVNEEFNFQNSFWYSVYTVFAGEPIPRPPKTFTGKLVTVFLMFMGLTIFAIFAGTVSAFMIDRIRLEGRIVEWDELHDHIVICGWTPKTEIIIREYRAGKNKKTRTTPIVIITETEKDKISLEARELPNVIFINDDFTKPTALERAGIRQAKTCLVLADLSGGRSEQDADARTILASLTVEKINQDVYTCAELLNRSYASHLDLGKVNDYVVSGEYGAYMIAQSAMHRGLVNVLNELLSYQHGNEFYRAQIPKSWVGARFEDKMVELKSSQNAILVGVHQIEGETLINPQDYLFQKDDEVLTISSDAVRLT